MPEPYSDTIFESPYISKKMAWANFQSAFLNFTVKRDEYKVAPPAEVVNLKLPINKSINKKDSEVDKQNNNEKSSIPPSQANSKATKKNTPKNQRKPKKVCLPLNIIYIYFRTIGS